METLELEIAVARYFEKSADLIVPNVSWGFQLNYEADLMILTKSGCLYEVEIKVSKSDMKAELKKRRAHSCRYVKFMFYAFPEEYLETAVEIFPEDAGLLVACKRKNGLIFVSLHRKPKKREHISMSLEKKYQLARLGALRIWSLKGVINSRIPKQLEMDFQGSIWLEND